MDEHNSLTEQISKLNELLLSKQLMFQVSCYLCFLTCVLGPDLVGKSFMLSMARLLERN